ncbi:MAG: hypothetical protein JHD35_12475 [Sphingopyxis sp.]|nr:hypothetical protein [Sphingopyxis sp.]
MSDDKLPSALIWHLECMEFSAAAIRTFRPPADPFQMRMHYSLFITHLFSMIDLLKDLQGKYIDAELNAELAESGCPDQNVIPYLRELRNGIVHRGTDPTSGGTVIDGVVHTIAPFDVSKRNGSRTLAPPVPLLWPICEISGECAKRVARRHIAYFLQGRPKATLDQVRIAIDAVPHMPKWAKDTASKHITEEMIGLAHNAQVEKLDRLLEPGFGAYASQP